MVEKAYFWSPVLIGLGLCFMPTDNTFVAFISGSLIMYGNAANRIGGWWW